jgi:DNA polymerase-3 subunit alpha
VLSEDLICTIKGRLQRRDDGSVTITAMELKVPDIDADGQKGPIILTLPEHRATEQNLRELETILLNHRGDAEVRINLTCRTKDVLMRLSPRLRVNPNPALYGDLKVLFGSSCLEKSSSPAVEVGV